MKKLLLLTALLIGFLVKAQDFAYLSSLNKIATDKEAINIADDIAALQDKKLRLLRAQEFPENHVLMIRYVPVEMTNEQYDKLELGDQDKFLTVTFNLDFEGANKDLERVGVKTYKFKKISGAYLQLFPIWKKYYKYEAQLEATLADAKLQKYVDAPNKLFFSIEQDNYDNWFIINQSRK